MQHRIMIEIIWKVENKVGHLLRIIRQHALYCAILPSLCIYKQMRVINKFGFSQSHGIGIVVIVNHLQKKRYSVNDYFFYQRKIIKSEQGMFLFWMSNFQIATNFREKTFLGRWNSRKLNDEGYTIERVYLLTEQFDDESWISNFCIRLFPWSLTYRLPCESNLKSLGLFNWFAPNPVVPLQPAMQTPPAV